LSVFYGNMVCMKKDQELAGIELLRFICAFVVLIWHYQHFLVLSASDENILAQLRSELPLHALFLPAYKYGYWAVQVFWLISGFIFYRQYANSISRRTVSIGEFSVRRFSRLYPLHFATLLIVALGQTIYLSLHGTSLIYHNNTAVSFAYQLFFASSWFSWQQTNFNGPIWSISSEIPVYFLFFLTVRLFGPSVLVALLGWAISWILSETHFAESFLNPNILSCAAFFFAGGVVQRFSKYRGTFWVGVGLGVATAALIALHFCIVDTKTVLVLAASAVIIFSSVEIRVFSPLSFLGNATYSSYLIHFPLQLFIIILFDQLRLSGSFFFHPAAFIGYLCSVTIVSLAVYQWFEKPAQDWIRSMFKSSLSPKLRSSSVG